ncbi:hypothetical protein DID77_04175 [Candidatus Marinamargulisbacteria bacterium SCGC AG-439-L15]|nr:hypothetical protein DID77_04175 [Candidatus Marinamargulisbacteria bacterium SCGC AG-439-L15]
MIDIIKKEITLKAIYISTILILSVAPLFGATIQIKETYLKEDFFKTNELLNVVLFEEKEKSNNEDEFFTDDDNQKESIRIGLVKTDNTLALPLFQLDYFATPEHHINIHSITAKDLNLDGLLDLMIHLSETGEGGYQSTRTIFMVNTGKSFQELKQQFKRDQYTFIKPNIIKREQPLDSYGKPFEETNPQQNELLWQDFFQFEKTQLININSRYKVHYQSELKKAEKTLNNRLYQLKKFRMDLNNQNASQLSLNELYYDITNYKILIERCRQVIQ